MTLPPRAPNSYRSPPLYSPPKLEAPAADHIEYVKSWFVLGMGAAIGLGLARLVTRFGIAVVGIAAVGLTMLVAFFVSPIVYLFCHFMGWAP